MNRTRFLKANKFGAIKTRIQFDGQWIWCPSKLEAAVGSLLELKRLKGEAKDLKYQHCVDLTCGVRWKVDFSYRDAKSGELIFWEAKGKVTQDFKIKLKLFKVHGPGKLVIWMGTYLRPAPLETIIPERLQLQDAQICAQIAH